MFAKECDSNYKILNEDEALTVKIFDDDDELDMRLRHKTVTSFIDINSAAHHSVRF